MTAPALHLPVTAAIGDPRWLLLLLLVPVFWWIGKQWPPAIGPGRKWTALTLRAIGVLLLALALAGFTLVRTHDDLGVIFLVDGSDSVPPQARAAALQFAKDATKAMRTKDQAGIVVFGRDARVESAPRPKLDVPDKLESEVDKTATDLAGALRVADGVFPPDAKKRAILLTDGLQNRGNLEEESVAAAAEGIQLDYLPLTRGQGPEVLVERVQSPARVAQDQAFDVQVVIRPFDDTKCTVRLNRDGALVDQQLVDLQAGRPLVVSFPQKLKEGGSYTYEAVIEPVKDTIPQNNSGISYTRVEGKPRVLIVSESKSHGRYLESALAAGGFDVKVGGVDSIETSLATMAAYDSIVLENVAATDLTKAQMETLRAFARDYGGGLVAVGGDQSYGVGGWMDTPLEEAMPVKMTLKETEEHPSVCLEIVIDKSGSMEGTDPSGVSKIQMAKEAAISAVDLLTPRDYVGVIAFDDAAQVVLPPTRLTSKGSVEDAIGSIGGGGGTDFFPALEAGREACQSTNAAVKHVLLASDGQSNPGDIAGMEARMHAGKVTLSTIAIGGDADQHTMAQLAQLGGGNYYFSPDAESLPRIFSRETILVAHNYVIEEPFTPAITTGGGMIRGFEGIALPTLYGYVGTTKKDQATLWMKTHKGDPLLASWRIGLGKAIAWTSDDEPRWSKDWVNWEGYSKFWTQVIRYSLGARESQGLTATASIDDEGVLRIEAEAADAGGDFANFRDVRAEIVGPDRKHVELPLHQTGPGRYAGVTRADQVGAYLVTVAMGGGGEGGGAAGGGEIAARAVAGASVSYSPEYRISAGDGGLLARVAARTGGLALTAPAMVFRPPEVPARVPKEVTDDLLWAAALLFLLDVAVRRVMIGRESFAWIAAKLRPSAIPVTTHVAGLAAAKQRGNKPPAPSPSVPSRSPAPSPSPIPSRSVVAAPPQPRPNVPAPTAPARSNPDAPAPPVAGNLAGSLLDRVKKNKK